MLHLNLAQPQNTDEVFSDENDELVPPKKKNEKSCQLFPENYYTEVASIYDQLSTKHAEKEAKQRELSLKLISSTPYGPFYNVCMRLDEEYGPEGDFMTKYLADTRYVRCRYGSIFTLRQAEFSGSYPLNTYVGSYLHKPGDIPSGVYPAAKIPLFEDRQDKFVVLGEGPYLHTFPVLLDRLTEQKVNVLIAIGPPEENKREKYYNYMSIAQEISLEEYLCHANHITDVPHELKNAKDTDITIKFYRYIYPESKNIFYIMHVPSWKDFGLPILTETDKHILAYDAEYGGNRFYHCSAGVGRSVALVMMRMAYELIFKNNLDSSQAVKQFEGILKRIKDVKPRAGEWWQLLLAVGLAEEMYIYMASQPAIKAENMKEVDNNPFACHANNNSSSSLLAGNLTLFAQPEGRNTEENKNTHDSSEGLLPSRVL